MRRIFCVEDDEDIRELLIYTLDAAGFETDGFESGESFFLSCERLMPDLVLLDIMLPGKDGSTILAEMRKDAKLHAVPVIMLTAKSAQIDKIRNLNSGADDYITKPFDISELLSRINAVLRRSNPEEEDTVEYGGIMVNRKSHTVTVNGEEVELTYKEFELINILMRNKGVVFSRGRLMDEIWGIDYVGETRTVDVHIRTLRRKLGECGDCIETVRNVGYRVG